MVEGGHGVGSRVAHRVGLAGQDEDFQLLPGKSRIGDSEEGGSDCQEGRSFQWIEFHLGFFVL